MDNNSKEALRQPVSPYLLRPLRDLEIARLEGIVRKSRTDAWARGADAGRIGDEALQAVQSAFPEMGPTAVTAAVEPPAEDRLSPTHRPANKGTRVTEGTRASVGRS